MVFIFALLAAFSNAVNEADQHIASTAAPHQASGWRLIPYLLRDRRWLFGAAAQVAAFVFQALALHNGAISVVQPLLATELVFMLVLRQFWIHQAIAAVTWVAAAVTCAGLTVFLVAGAPTGGQSTPASHHWLTAALGCCAGAAVLAAVARTGLPPGVRAALYATAGGAMWALVAAFIKATTDTLTQSGIPGLFTSWPLYALALGSVAGIFLEQAALHVGPLRASQPFLVIVDPIVSIFLSVWLFGEHFASDPAVLATAAAGFAVMSGAVVLLTQTTPATMKSDTSGQNESAAADRNPGPAD